MLRVYLLVSLLFLASSLHADEQIDFDADILPILTKSGCNAGSCHGAAIGRGGFHLSLWGSNPSDDFAAIIRFAKGRRIDLANPLHSLLLLKASGNIDHEGGAVLDETSSDFNLLRDWISQGAQRNHQRIIQQVTIRVDQQACDPDIALQLPIEKEVAIEITAKYQDGTHRNIAHLATVTIPDSSSLRFDADNKTITALRHGIHTFLIRYMNQVIAFQVIATSNSHPETRVTSKSPNDIDQFILERQMALGTEPGKPADDLVLLRRVTLDLIGRLPSVEEITTFTQQTDANRYTQLVDRLIASSEFTDFWTYRWGRDFGLRPNSNSPQGIQSFQRWLKIQIAENRPLDQIIQQMITATGDSHDTSPAFFILIDNDPRKQAERIAQLFLGARMECANCHDHPLDRWQQDDYHGLAAIFARLDRKQVVSWLDRGAVTNPRTGQPAEPKIPGERKLPVGMDHRNELANWLLDPEHPHAARAFVNRHWAHFFGRGLVHPVDDIRTTNPATHPQLLSTLTNTLVSHNYDFRLLTKQIVLSSAYQRLSPDSLPSSLNDFGYVYGPRKPLPAEVLLDMLADATAVPELLSNDPSLTRSILVADPTVPSEALDALGRCTANRDCNSSTANTSLTAMLHWINGETLNKRIQSPNGWLAQRLTSTSDEELVTEMYLRTLSRAPQEVEKQTWLTELKELDPTARKPFFEDLFWALLTSNDFIHNH